MKIEEVAERARFMEKYMNDPTLFNYINAAALTAIYPDAGRCTPGALAYVSLGLVGEAGEIANKIKKILRDDGGNVTDEKKLEIKKELGDVFWYMAMLMLELDLDEKSVMQGNLEKLFGRQARGALGGSGDER